MTAKTDHILGFLTEYNTGTTQYVFGTPQTSPIVDGTTLYKIGHFHAGQAIKLPVPTPELKGYSYQNDLDVSFFDVGTFPMKAKLPFILMNGIPLYYALGESVNTAPSYNQHVLTGNWAAGVNEHSLPSLTLHHEARNGTKLVSEYYGGKVSNCNISGQKGDWVECELGMLFSKMAEASDSSMAELSADPALPATAQATGYPFDKIDFTYDSNPISTIVGFNFGISIVLEPVFVHRTPDGEFAYAFLQKKRSYAFELTVLEEDHTFLSPLLAQSNKTLEIKLNRGLGTYASNDYIDITATNCKISGYSKAFKTRAGEYAIPVLGVVEGACSITVQDQISGDFYPDHTTP